MKLKTGLAVYLLLFFYNVAWAQPSFTVSQTRGCVPVTVTVTSVSNGFTNLIYYLTTLSGTSTLSESTPYVTKTYLLTYNKAGEDSIVLTYNNGGVGDSLPYIPHIYLYDATAPAFSLKNCTGRVTNLSIDEAKYDYYSVGWGDASAVQTVAGNGTLQHTYSDVSTRNVTVTGFYSYSVLGVGMQTCGNFTIKSNKPYSTLSAPSVSYIQVTDNTSPSGTIVVSLSTPDDYPYKIFQKAGYTSAYPSNPIDSVVGVSGVQTLTFTGLDTKKNNYCYKFTAYDYCPLTADQSTIDICSISLTGEALSTGNNMSWSLYPSGGGVVFYNLSVGGAAIPAATFLTGTGFLDTDVKCQQTYCYQTEAQFGGFPAIRSISAPYCVVAKKPVVYPQPVNFHASYEGNQLKLFWAASTIPGMRYYVYATSTSADLGLTPFDSTSSTSIFPKQNSICYALSLGNECSTSPHVRACPVSVLAQYDNLEQNSGTYTVYYNGDNIAVATYEVEQYDDAYVFLRSNMGDGSMAFVHNLIDTVNQKINYKIKATLVNGVVVYSNYSSVIQKLRLFMPNAFTPNGDNLNDSFGAKGLFFNTFELKVYNRWGQQVFSADTQSSTWDGGSFNPDIYHYYIKVTDKFGDEKVEKGIVYLMRQ